MNLKEITVRNPDSIRPYQHVLDPLFAYLLIAKKQFENNVFSGCYNIGPDESGCISTGQLVDLFCKKWEEKTHNKQIWVNKSDGGPHETNFLMLDCSKMKAVFGWKTKWSIKTAIEKTIEWTQCFLTNGNVPLVMDQQIKEYYRGIRNV
jgi:CDP-glucose 4,6-dehydratase